MSWILRNSKLAIRFSLFDANRRASRDMLRMRILHQEEELRSKESCGVILFQHDDGMNVYSQDRPRMVEDTVFIRGVESKEDHKLVSREFAGPRDRLSYLNRAILAFEGLAEKLKAKIILRGSPSHYVDVILISEETARKYEHANAPSFSEFFTLGDE